MVKSDINNSKISIGASIEKKIFTPLYHATWPLAISWTIFTLIFSLVMNHEQCVESVNAYSWLTNIGWISLIMFIFITIAMISFTKKQLSTIKSNERSGKDELKNISITEGANNSTDYIVCKTYINVLPLYLIGVYSISRLIIFFMSKDNKLLDFHFLTLLFWFILLIFSWYYWYKLKKYANKDYIISISYTLFIITITWLSLYWETLIPYVIDIFNISSCISKKYIIENSIESSSFLPL